MTAIVSPRVEAGKLVGVGLVRGYDPDVLAKKFQIERYLVRRGLRGLELENRALALLQMLGFDRNWEAQATNTLVNGGTNAMLLALTGSAIPSGGYYNNANANLGVGDSSTAFAATQTDLQAGANIKLKPMDATFPSVAANVATLRATFAVGDANFVWNEWAIFNGITHGTNTMLNRAVPAGGLGTKTNASAWQFTVTLTQN